MLFKRYLNQYCLLCSSHDGGNLGVCTACLQNLPWHNQAQCPQCGLLSNGLVCGSCLDSPPLFDATHSLFTYNYPVDGLLQHYKYRETLHLAKTFATLFFEQKIANSQKVDQIIAMPMHKTRLQQRGFNQALELARILAKMTQTPLVTDACQRIKLTPPQASLPLKERIPNIRSVFECNKDLKGKNIAIVDDVMTTGASMNELAKTLKQAGAARVECWVIARTLPK